MIVRRSQREKIFLTTSITVMSVPILYAYSVPALDAKYFYPLYPIFCILSAMALEAYVTKIQKKNAIVIFGLIIVLVGSIVFLQVKIQDIVLQHEYVSVAKLLVEKAKGVNYYSQSAYLKPLELEKNWPIKKTEYVNRIKIVNSEHFTSLESYIKSSRKDGLTHIIVDDYTIKPEFLKDIFSNKKKYSYLEEIFDYKDLGFKYRVKIFKIDYKKFEVK